MTLYQLSSVWFSWLSVFLRDPWIVLLVNISTFIKVKVIKKKEKSDKMHFNFKSKTLPAIASEETLIDNERIWFIVTWNKKLANSLLSKKRNTINVSKS